MAGYSIPITPRTHETLKSMSEESGEPLQSLLEKIVEKARHRQIMEESNKAWAKLRADPAAWEEELAERKLWEATLLDGIEEDL